MKHLILTFVISIAAYQGSLAQNLIGKSVEQVQKYMKTKHPEYTCDVSSLKNKHSSLKYVDFDEMRTLMFFFDDIKKCKYSKFILDNSLLKNSLDSLNKNYNYQGNLVWIEKQLFKEFAIAMQKNEWFFTIIIQPKED
jgi:hypothetical protein